MIIAQRMRHGKGYIGEIGRRMGWRPFDALFRLNLLEKLPSVVNLIAKGPE
jgi:hypothetical protein